VDEDTHEIDHDDEVGT